MRNNPLWSRPALQLALVAIVGLLAYSNSFQVPFFLDDETSILDNWVIADLGEFLSGTGYSYNPRRFIGYLTVAINYRIGGVDATGYHAVNLGIHILSAWLVYLLAGLTLRTPFISGAASAEARPSAAGWCIPLGAALLFVAHPVQTQAVTYIIQRLTSLCTLFYLLSLVCYAKARLVQEEQRRPFAAGAVAYYLLALAAAGCAMKTKEIAFTLPFIIVLYEFLFFRMSATKKLLFLLPVVLTVLIVPLSLVGTDRPLGELLSDVTAATRVDTEVPRLHYLFTQFPVIATYLRLLFLPINQNLDYDFPIYRTLASAPVLLSLLLILGVAALALLLFHRSRRQPELRLISFGIFWFFITLGVESSVIPIADVIFEHRVYLPSVGAFIALAGLATLLAERIKPLYGLVAAGVVVLALAGTTFARNEVWGSELTLWGDVVEKSPRKARPHYNLALALYQAGRYDEALRHASEAASLDPAAPYSHNLMGSILGRRGELFKAMAAFAEALRLAPQYLEARLNLADTYRQRGYTLKALEHYQVALEREPTAADIYYRIGLTHAIGNDLQKAAVFYQCAVRLDPKRLEYRQDLMRVQEALSKLTTPSGH